MKYCDAEVRETVKALCDEYNLMDWYYETEGSGCFGENLKHDNFGISAPCKNLGKVFHVATGATKMVIIPPDTDYVIKIPNFGDNVNYCEREAKIYKEAVKIGIEQAFAEVRFFGDMYDANTGYNFPVYLAEKARCDSDEVENSAFSAAKEEVVEELNSYGEEIPEDEDEKGNYTGELSSLVYNKLSSYNYNDNDDEDEIYYLMSQALSEDCFNDFCNFCDDNHINDLHSGNAGWVDDRFVLVDYSGYGINEDSSEDSSEDGSNDEDNDDDDDWKMIPEQMSINFEESESESSDEEDADDEEWEEMSF